ncbi:MAG: Mov34/MPN/PAD-1 family protein [Candidatus ainarchaeum sp.]|nr:Mov34/MPN/PAD-1 family protein [Candidatus ainarchaeum sp.]
MNNLKKILVKRQTLESIAEASKNVFPKEFIALLGSKSKNSIIDELVIIPATFGDSFSSVYLDLLPFDKSILGSVHSHPSDSNRPSSADKRFFKKTGEIHLIICLPFSISSIRAYDAEGKEIEMEVIE